MKIGFDDVQTRRIIVIDKMVSLVMYGIAASAIAEVVGMPLASLLAVGGISGIAVGLAAKEVISNMFGGASIFLTRPFVIGEIIRVSPHELYSMLHQDLESRGLLKEEIQPPQSKPASKSARRVPKRTQNTDESSGNILHRLGEFQERCRI